jgi:hypothetical protein
MKFYFDIKEIFVKTIAIEAENIEQAERRVQGAYNRKEFKINREHPDDVNFIFAQDDVEKCIQQGFFSEEELETFNCNDVV